MDRLYGSTLRSELKRTGKLPPFATTDRFGQFLNGLRAAHGAGIAHRDLKPENVFITPLEMGDHRITILDFGLAKLRLGEAAEMDSLTTLGTVMGTLGYMSPEQLSGQASDERSDLFSTGVMIFEGITGTLPFQATSYADLLRAMSHNSPTVPGDSVEIVRLNSLLRKCLAPNRNNRFQTATELQSELLPALRSWSHMN
jgi:serine/threonine protein kinase